MIGWMARGLRRGAQGALEALAEASRERAPRKSGSLRASCRVETDAEGRGGRVRYTAPYAAAQHENAGVRHRDGQAKYLESAAKDPAVRERMLSALAAGLKEETRG